MFERFTPGARAVVVTAARSASPVTDEHLLLALAGHGSSTAAWLRSAGVNAEVVSSAFRAAERRAGLSDAEAAVLSQSFGIDLDDVVARVESALGENALVSRGSSRGSFSVVAKEILRGALDQARALRHRELREEHLLLALAAHEGVAGQLLAAHGMGYLEVRASLAKAS
ncbi:Clp protease N-terminal domain-containing protein [Actinophytocola oryzae]|uniref:ClpA/ClpB-like protein n=1 Tax=Actinophytocola oryzae TaxID=502181 RepID=A0A4R7VCS7_9PSEU|nr:Clp protease N-terminal domain-containing protein [Actinophytocola oryzae]TDV46912.1 ClpA/ClpB-like protein [Actinophytocola oryzae]